MNQSSSLRQEGFSPIQYLFFSLATLVTLVVCVSAGSVAVPVRTVFRAVSSGLFGTEPAGGMTQSIIMTIRLPRVLSAALVGASLSLCGAAMQGLLRNPLAEGSTMGVASGASLGAVLSIAFGITVPGFSRMGPVAMAMLFAFLSLTMVLALAWRLDASFSTNTLLLIGVIFSMFVGAFISLVITFSGSKLRSVTFWTMGSLADARYEDVLILLAALIPCAATLLLSAPELNAFAVGEDNARSIGVNVRAVTLRVMIAVSVLIGVSVSLSGSIGFVGLVTPHMARLIVGPNHKKLLPAVLFSGAIFLMLTDLVARTALNPLELPLGVVTSLIGAVVFLVLFSRSRRGA